MMKLSLMKDVFNTVNSDWDCELANELLVNWNHNDNWIKMWRASANFICYFKYNNKKYVLRFNREDERQFDEISAEIKYINYLKSNNIKLAKLMLSKNNKFFEETKTSYGKFYSCVFEYISGKQLEIDQLSLKQFYEWGKCLGKIHKVTKECSIQINRKNHKELFEEIITKYPANDKIEKREAERIKCWLNTLKINKEVYGIIHYDFELDNLIWNGNNFYIIDFDDAIYSWYIADIAYALRDLFDEGDEVDLHDLKFIEFIKGYSEMTKLSDDQINQIPYFYKFHNFISYKKIEKSIDIDINNKNPDWMNKLIIKLSNFKTKYYNLFQKDDIWN